MTVNTAYVCWNGCELLSLRKHTVAVLICSHISSSAVCMSELQAHNLVLQ